MENTFPIYRKNDTWYRAVTEIPRDENDINIFPSYDEMVYVEVPGYRVPINTSLDTLLELHQKYHWGKHGGMGLKEPYKDGEVITMSAFLHEKGLANY